SELQSGHPRRQPRLYACDGRLPSETRRRCDARASCVPLRGTSSSAQLSARVALRCLHGLPSASSFLLAGPSPGLPFAPLGPCELGSPTSSLVRQARTSAY